MVATSNNGLKGHAWGKNYSIEEISEMPLPAPTKTYSPVPQASLYKMWSTRVVSAGYNISGEEHWATNDKDVFVSLITISAPSIDNTVLRWQAALINSYNKQVSIKTAVGANVFVCTNGCLSAEFMHRTKHTGGVWGRLEEFLFDSVDNIGVRIRAIANLFDKYKQADASSDRQVDHLVCKAYRAGIIPASGVGQVLDHWRTPEHPEFKDRNVWSLYNAFTSYDRGRSMFERSSRVNRLHGLLNDEFQIDAATPQQVADRLMG
jgi:hypothetical protein